MFDGVCNLCSHAVDFILAHERDHVIWFAAAQSASGQELLLKCGFDPREFTTFVLLKGGIVYVRSDLSLIHI